MFRNLMPVRETLPRPLDAFQREMEGMVDRFFGPRAEWLHGGGGEFLPRTDVAETETEFEVTAELPGLKPEELSIELKDGDLWITGEKKDEREDRGKTYHRVERHYGQFCRVVSLPAVVDAQAVKAEFKDGVLHVHVPKTESAKPRKIEIKS